MTHELDFDYMPPKAGGTGAYKWLCRTCGARGPWFHLGLPYDFGNVSFFSEAETARQAAVRDSRSHLQPH